MGMDVHRRTRADRTRPPRREAARLPRRRDRRPGPGKITDKGGATEWIHWRSGTAQLLPRLIARRTRGPLFLTDRKAPAGTPTLDVCPETGRARLSYRRAEEIFEENTRLLANPLASPEDIEDLDGWTLHRLRHSALTQPRTARPRRCCWPAPATPPSAPWSGTPVPASTPSPVMSPSVTPPHVAGRDGPRLRLVTAFLPAPRHRRRDAYHRAAPGSTMSWRDRRGEATGRRWTGRRVADDFPPPRESYPLRPLRPEGHR